MKIDIITLFPSMYSGFLNESIIKRAINKNLISINIHNLRDYSTDKFNRVDDYQIGGGAGMVIMPEPVFNAIESIKTSNSFVIMLTPQGVKYNQKIAYDLSEYKHLILLCGHYEGFDERILSIVDMELSIGDYILTGGELASMIVTDSIVRLVDGVIEKESHENETFNNNLLDYPVYTKPIDFRGIIVPDVLLSGHHENIRKWRYEQSFKKTQKVRPDLLEMGNVNEKK
ncbi:MAG: tRNA (guanosine(37)-N1)-methyltransferase TrmD [Bacilli bacterium]